MKCHDLRVSNAYMVEAFTTALIAMVSNIEINRSQFMEPVIRAQVWHL
jgi:hypothetical protein